MRYHKTAHLQKHGRGLGVGERINLSKEVSQRRGGKALLNIISACFWKYDQREPEGYFQYSFIPDKTFRFTIIVHFVEWGYGPLYKKKEVQLE